MKRCIWIVAAILAVLATSTHGVAQVRPPNIVVIVADDLGYADIGVQGSKDIPTPNIDALAAGGVRFTDAYVSGPYCSPTRAGLLTGRYPQRFGHEFNIGGARHREAGLPVEEITMADRLKAAGYRTALVGKWHLGFGQPFLPTRRGFEEFFGFLAGGHSYVAPGTGNNRILSGTDTVPSIPYLTDTLAGHAADFIRRHKAQPFFLYLAFNAVHVPMQATPRYVARFPHISDERRRTYAAMLSAMDDGIGRTIDALRAARLEENTLIFFFSDNGGPIGLNAAGEDAGNGSSNAPLRGSKGSTWEGGVRVPFIMRWKGRLPEGKTYSEPIIQLDVLPTALAAANIQIRPDWRLDGVNLLPFVTGARSDPPHDALYWRTGVNVAIRKGDWKLVKTSLGGVNNDTSAVTLAGAGLFNVNEDIGEKNNLAANNPAKLKELQDAWQHWNSELAKPGWRPPGLAPAALTQPPSPAAAQLQRFHR